ncbi:hypothetical protein [Gordonia humi]|uniref:Uncharacterized protein n=1 Tax=Gordonia humi TaxID=686429 RepID=A0A840EWM5_9ACTN|nr:hypothetical protein [Gordonia humi]MBB4136072.1 hypothetical protein [Gordonia humi]
MTEKKLAVPETCHRGHVLTARTTYIKCARVGSLDSLASPVGWECVRCLRLAAWRAHHGADAPVPADLLDDSRFVRQLPRGKGGTVNGPWPDDPAGWWTLVEFASGWSYTEPDPTPEDYAQQEEHMRTTIARELDEIEMRDARHRRAQRRQDAQASTAAIRSAMTAARGGVA